MSTKKYVPMITETIYTSGCEYGRPLSEYIRELQTMAEKAPKEYRDKVEISIETYESYGSSSVEVTLTYARPKTQSELDLDEARKKQNEEYERRQYEALKKKFG